MIKRQPENCRQYGLLCYFLFFTLFAVTAQTPAIRFIIPSRGAAGTTTTIYGNGFHPVADSNIVYFGGVKAGVLNATSTELKVMVPPGSTHELVTVTVPGRKTAFSNIPFSPQFSPWSNSFRFNPASFAPKIDFTSGNGPAAIALADFNTDGKPDVVIANTGSNTVSLFTNTSSNGTISFAPRADIASGSGPKSIAIADFDGDGKQDMAVACSTGVVVSIYLNTTTGSVTSFGSRTDIAVFLQPTKLVANDIDRDGKPDLAVISHQSSLIRLYRNTSSPGATSFVSLQSLSTNGSVTDLVVAEMLLVESPPEVAAISKETNTLTIFKNNSAPGVFSFDDPATYATGTSPAAIRLFNLNMNPIADLAVVNTGSNSISTYTNNFINFLPKVDIAVGPSPTSLAVFDMRGDGTMDLLTASQSASTISVIQNDSLKGYIPGVNYPTGTGPVAITACDLDLDGRPDIITVNGTANNFSVHRNLVNETAPFISGFTPVKAAAGLPVTIRGKNFTNVNAVLFGGTPSGSFTVLSDTVITAQPGAGANGFVTCYTATAYGKLPGFTFDRPAGPVRIINTIAGNGVQGYSGDGGNALNAALNRPFKVQADTTGGSFLYIGELDNFRIRKVNLATGIITTIAGNGVDGFTGDGGPATAAQIGRPHGIATDKYGNLFFYTADDATRVRKVDATTGIITTVAGGGLQRADNVPAVTASLSLPAGIAIDKDSNLLYMADFRKIRKINLTTGIITTVAGSVDLFFTGSDADSIPAVAARFNRIRALAIDKNRNLYLSDNKWVLSDRIGARVRKIDAVTGIITTLAGDGNIGRDGDGGQGKLAQMGFCESLATDTSGRYLYMTQSNEDGDTTANSIRMLDMHTGIITTIAGGNSSPGYGGDGGDALLAQLSSPPGITVDNNNQIYISDNTKYIRRIAFLNTSLALCPGGSTSLSSDVNGTTYQWQVALSDTSAFNNIVNSIQLSGANTATLQLNSIPSSWYGYAFRCVVNGSNGRRYVLKFENRWTGAVSTAWENPANWSCGLIPDANTDVYVNGTNVLVNSNAICRSLSLTGGASVTISPGFTLTITH